MAMSKEEFVKEAIEKDVSLKRKLFSEELDRYMKSFKQVNDNYRSYTALIGEMHNFPSKEVPQFINKLMPVVLANLSQKHEVVCTLNKDNSWSSRVVVATAQGLRCRSEHGFHTQDLTAKAIREIFTTKANDVEAWIKTNKPKKLQDWIDFKDAFVNGFKDSYCDDGDRYSSYGSKDDDKATIEIVKRLQKKEMSWIDEREHNYSIERQPFDVDDISIRYNIPRNSGVVYFINLDVADTKNRGVLSVTADSGYISFEPNNALKMMEFRELLPQISSLIDEAKDKINTDNKVQKAWWAQFNKTMNKWVSMINL